MYFDSIENASEHQCCNKYNQRKYEPGINWSSSYNKISLASSKSGNSFFSNSRTGSSFDEYSSGFTLSQNIYDFGKTPTRMKIQNFNLASSRSDLENLSEQIIFNVKQTYFGVLQAKRNRDVSTESVKSQLVYWIKQVFMS